MANTRVTVTIDSDNISKYDLAVLQYLQFKKTTVTPPFMKLVVEYETTNTLKATRICLDVLNEFENLDVVDLYAEKITTNNVDTSKVSLRQQPISYDTGCYNTWYAF